MDTSLPSLENSPPVMVKATILADKLRTVIGDGVDSALLLTTSGSLLACASARTEFSRSQECRMLSALVANMWRTYAQTSSAAEEAIRRKQALMVCQREVKSKTTAAAAASSENNDDTTAEFARDQQARIAAQQKAAEAKRKAVDPHELELVLAELETNKLCAFGMGGRAVLALFASNTTEIGLLKLKAASLQAELFDGMRLALRNFDDGNGNKAVVE